VLAYRHGGTGGVTPRSRRPNAPLSRSLVPVHLRPGPLVARARRGRDARRGLEGRPTSQVPSACGRVSSWSSARVRAGAITVAPATATTPSRTRSPSSNGAIACPPRPARTSPSTASALRQHLVRDHLPGAEGATAAGSGAVPATGLEVAAGGGRAAPRAHPDRLGRGYDRGA